MQSHTCASITMCIYKTSNFSALMIFNDRLGKTKVSFNYPSYAACNWMLTAQNLIANKIGRQISHINTLLKETKFYFQFCFMQEWSKWKHSFSEWT